MNRFRWVLSAAVLIATVLLAPSAATKAPRPVDRTLSAYNQALLHHTSLQPVVEGRRIMAGENLVSGDDSVVSATAAQAGPTPNVTQNGVCNDQKAEANVGETRIFWVHNFKLMTDIQKTFQLVAKTPHVYMWVATEQLGTVVTPAQAQAGAEHFESIYTTDRSYFGHEARCDEVPFRQPPRMQDIWGSPWYDADDDRHINIVNFDPDVGATVVAGYYSSADEYPKTVNEHSNEGEFFYMNSLLFTPGTATYDSILAHEFYHMIQFANDANEETWANEGMADVAIEVNGFGSLTSSHTSDYASHPEDQLTTWDGQLYDYGNAYSFFSYFLEHYGPPDNPSTPFKENYALAKAITQFERDGLAGVDDILASNPYKGGLAPSYQDNTANDVYLDRAVANVVNDRSLADGQYGYGQLASFGVNPHGGFSSFPASGTGSTAPYGDRIYHFDSAADGTFDVDADALIPIVNNLSGMPSPTHELWGNRTDESVTFAERSAALPTGSSPHLKFGYWYDIEQDFDYAYVRVSDDGGATWDNIACCGSTTTNPNGNNRGNGITGLSGGPLGPSWQSADVDLSAYAGKTVKIRFEYQTDPAVLHPGFTVDNVELVSGGTAIWPLATFESDDGGFTLGGNGAATFLRIEPNQANRLVLQLVKLGRGIGVSRFNGTTSGATVSASGPMDSFRTYAIFTSLTPITSELYDFSWNAQASAPPALTPSTLSATGAGTNIQLSWTPASNAGALSPASYLIEESTIFQKPIDDNAESGLAPNWTSETVGMGALGWSTSQTKKRSGSQSFWGTAGEGATDAASILRFNQPVTLPTAGRTLLTFWDWHINESDDSVNVDVRQAGMADWTTVLSSGRSATPEVAGPALATEPMTERKVDLAAWKGKTIELRFRFQAGSANRPGSTPFGWYVDDVKLVTEDWQQIAEVPGSSSSYTVNKTAPGTFFYRIAALYTQFARGPYSNVASATTANAPADLVVPSVVAGNTKGVREGDKVTVTATIRNAGGSSAGASKTEFLLDGTTVLGLVDTPVIAAGATAQVSVQWDTRSVKGSHTIRVTADKAGTVAESSDTNNAATLTVTVQGNKVKNGSFEQTSSSGNGPDAWSGSSTTAGSSSSSQNGGTNGSKAVTITGSGGNVAVSGSPAWTSDAFAVAPGEVLDVVASVKADGLSSPAGLGLAYLGAAGEVLSTVSVLTSPLTSNGFQQLEQTVTVPAGVAQVRVVLTGFSPTDLAARGTVTFDDVGVFAR